MGFDFEDNYEQDEYDQEEYDAPQVRPQDPIQERLQLASAYQALLERGVFADGTPATDKVEKEVQTFVRERLEVLVGYRIEAPKNTQAFSDEEVAILKVFAERIKNQQSAPSAPTVKTPELKPVATAPSVRPAIAPKAPSVKKPKPRKPRVAPRGASVAPAPPKPAKASVETFAFDKGKRYPTPRSKEESELIPDTEIFKIGPRFFMWRTNELGLRYRVNVTPQAGQSKANDLYTPMPTGTMFTAISAQQADNQAKQGKNAVDMGGREHSHANE